MAKTYAEQLDDVQNAIFAIESGAQQFQINNRMLTRANLKTLYEREIYLMKQVNRDTYGGIRVRGVTPS